MILGLHYLPLAVWCQRDSNKPRQPQGESSASLLNQLPPCRVVGNEILHSDQSCVFIPDYPDSDNSSDPRSSDNSSPKDGSFKVGGGSRSVPYDPEGRYWLVPPFLIGASVVIVLYIVVHCLYLHCYAKKKMRHLAARASQPHIVFDPDGPSSSSIPLTPVVKYERGTGRTELVEAQPFLFYEMDGVTSPETSDNYSYVEGQHLRLPSFLKRKRSPRASVCSASATIGSVESSDNFSEGRRDFRQARASICFVPVNRALSEPGGTKGSTRPSLDLSGAIPQNASFTFADGVSAGGSPVVFLPANASFCSREGVSMSDQAEQEQPAKKKPSLKSRSSTDGPKSKSNRKTSFKEPSEARIEEKPAVKIQIGEDDED